MKPILVTGAAKHLGAEICRQLAAKGHDVVIHYRTSENEAHQVALECRRFSNAEILFGDFSTNESLNAFISSYNSRFANTKGIVHNVGNYLIASLSETRDAKWNELFQTNFFTPVFLTQAILPSIKLQKGSIINIGLTGLNANRAFTQSTAYAATKSALLFYTIALAKELASAGVRVNMVSPGYLENTSDLKDPQQLPFARTASLVEVAQLVSYLFDPINSYITGQNIEIAGAVGL